MSKYVHVKIFQLIHNLWNYELNKRQKKLIFGRSHQHIDYYFTSGIEKKFENNGRH